MAKNKVYLKDGNRYVDTDFCQNSQNKLPNSELKHMGWGEFYLKTPDGDIQFARQDPLKFEGMSGRCHKLYDNVGGKLCDALIDIMDCEIVEV